MNKLKSALKRLLRPLVRRVYARIDMRVQHVLDDESISYLRGQGPVLLNLAASFAGAQREAKHRDESLEARVAALENRLISVRREILFEMKHRPDPGVAEEAPEARIVNASKLEEAGDDVRLNLGCGHIPLEEFINVDSREMDGVDVVADVLSLPFEPDTVSAIHSAHLLEHFPLEDLTRSALPHWFSLLRPGGSFIAIVPDPATMMAEYVAGRMPFEDLRRVTYGDQEYGGNFHFNMFSHQSLCEILRQAGFSDVTLVESGRRNGICYEMEVRATKPVRNEAPVHVGNA
jgi:predicted SAM-dependent methyltransferase